MPLITYAGVVIAAAAVTGLLLHARTEVPSVSVRQRRGGGALRGVPWVLILDPIVLFLGFCAYLGGQEVAGSGPAGVAAWGMLWPLAVEVASNGHPYRVARLFRLYSEHRFALPFTDEHKIYRKKLRLLRPTEWKLVVLILPVLLCGVALTGLLSGSPVE